MTDRTILDNARNMLLVTAGSFCLSLAGIAAHSGGMQRLQQEERSQRSEVPSTPAQLIGLHGSNS